MTAYSLALFLHILGALALFASFGLEGVALLNLRHSATVEQAREWAKVSGLVRWLGPTSMGLLLLAGLYMAATAWGPQAWIITAFVTMLFLPVLGSRSGRRVAAVARALAAEHGPLSAATRAELNDPFVLLAYQVRLAAALGIVFLMTVKPDWPGSLVTVGGALVAGLAWAVPALRRGRSHTPAVMQ